MNDDRLEDLQEETQDELEQRASQVARADLFSPLRPAICEEEDVDGE
jgi:hypothetical protein